MPQDTLQLTPQQAEQMRAILAAYDQQNGRVEKEFDLNNPKTPVYRHQEYPKILYHHDTRKSVTVNDAKQEAAQIAKGYKLEAFAREVPEAPEGPAGDEAAEIAALDKQARSKKEK